MKKLNFIHELTPPNLISLHQELATLFQSEDDNEARLLELIGLRDELINQHLLGLDDESKHLFAEAELKVNDKLKELTQNRLSGTLNQISGLIRGRKNVAKYK